MSDFPFALPPDLATSLVAVIDREGKIDRALEALGPILGRDVVAIDAGPIQRQRWTDGGARLTCIESVLADDARALPDGCADAIVSTWTGFRGVDAATIEAADRLLRPHGRLLVVHDYGRDDLSRLRGDQPEYGAWSRRDGPFLTNGFRVRVIHCFWTFDDLDAARRLIEAGFGAAATELLAMLKRPRLSWNVAVYHRDRGGAARADAADPGDGATTDRLAAV